MTEEAKQQTETIPTLGDLPAPVTEGDGNLTVDDIASAVQVIDYAVQQGAIRGWPDVIAVLSLRNRLWGFVKAYRAQQAAETPAARDPDAQQEAAAESAATGTETTDAGPPESGNVRRRRRVAS